MAREKKNSKKSVIKTTSKRAGDNQPDYLSLRVLHGEVLGVKVYRGYAPLNELAEISRADVYDSKKNPRGTQRELNLPHARDAYAYVKQERIAFWPEVFLCARDVSVLRFVPYPSDSSFGTLIVDKNAISSSDDISISRVDGNHRLHLADGHQANIAPLQKSVSFSLAYNLTREEEIKLFRDINKNQKRMNTSHLDNIEVRLSEEDLLKRDNPMLWIAERLASDSDSPFENMVFVGGVKPPGFTLPLRTLKTGIEYLFSQSKKIHDLPNLDVRYKVLSNFFSAVRKWQPQAWAKPQNYLVLRGAGFWGICLIGAEVIDRVISSGRFSSDEMMSLLKSGRDWDWSKTGDFRGLSGRGGASVLKQRVISAFADETGVSLSELSRRIMQSK